MKLELKKEIISGIEDLYGDIESEIANNQYEPSERGAGTATREDTVVDNIEAMKDFIITVLKKFGIEENMDDLTFEEVLEQINASNKWDFDELNELEERSDVDSNPKHVYKYTYFEHIKSKRIIEVCVDSNDYEDELMHKKEVKKVEKIIHTYE